MTFEFFHDIDLLGEILTPVDAQIDQWTFGNIYASEWKPLGSSIPEYRKRILAVGIVPSISYDPI